jgi:hypothetical protein
MRTTQKSRVQMFRRVRDLLRADVVPAPIQPTLTQLEGVINRLDAHATQQELSSRRARSGTQSLRDRVRRLRRELLAPVVLVGRAVSFSNDADVMALRSASRMPRDGDYEGLLASAQAIAKVVEDHQDAFVNAGLPKDHLARVVAETASLKAAIDARGQESARRVAATQGTIAESRRGLQLVRLIDALYAPTLASNESRLAEWRKAIALARESVAKGGEETVPTATTNTDAPTLPEVSERAA